MVSGARLWFRLPLFVVWQYCVLPGQILIHTFFARPCFLFHAFFWSLDISQFHFVTMRITLYSLPFTCVRFACFGAERRIALLLLGVLALASEPS